MFKVGDRVVFTFRSDSNDNRYKGFYCKLAGYYPRMSGVVIAREWEYRNDLIVADIRLDNFGGWSIPIDLLEYEIITLKELLLLRCDNQITTKQFYDRLSNV